MAKVRIETPLFLRNSPELGRYARKIPTTVNQDFAIDKKFTKTRGHMTYEKIPIKFVTRIARLTANQYLFFHSQVYSIHIRVYARNRILLCCSPRGEISGSAYAIIRITYNSALKTIRLRKQKHLVHIGRNFLVTTFL